VEYRQGESETDSKGELEGGREIESEKKQVTARKME
jgi:hypothetical protein